MEISDRLVAFDRNLLKLETRRNQAEKAAQASENQAEIYRAEADRLIKAVEVTQVAGQARREELRDRVESLVTQGLQAVFRRTDYRFSFDVELKRGKFGAYPFLYSQFRGKELKASIVDGHGGGIADVVSFLLRVVVLCLQRPRVSPVLVLDESFRHVSPGCLRGVAQLLRELNRMIGIQFILVTHKEELLDAADVIYRAKLKNGHTTLTCEHDMKDEAYHAKPKGGERRRRHDPFEGQEVWTHKEWEAHPTVVSETEDVQARKQRQPDYRQRQAQKKPSKKRYRAQELEKQKARTKARNEKKKRKR